MNMNIRIVKRPGVGQYRIYDAPEGGHWLQLDARGLLDIMNFVRVNTSELEQEAAYISATTPIANEMPLSHEQVEEMIEEEYEREYREAEERE